jgi:hypothetical protein
LMPISSKASRRSVVMVPSAGGMAFSMSRIRAATRPDW